MGNGWVIAGYLATFGGLAAYIVGLIRRGRALPRPEPPPADPER